MLAAFLLFRESPSAQNIDYLSFFWYNYIDNSDKAREILMPILYEAYDECEKCGKEFKWVHFEWLKSRLSDGAFRVEKLPEKPWAKDVHIIDASHKEYTVGCPHCGFYNHFIHKIEL